MSKVFSANTLAQIRAKLGLPPTATPAEIAAAIERLKAAANKARPVAASSSSVGAAAGDRPRRQGEKVVDWAVATGRIAASTAHVYRDFPEASAEMVLASRPAGLALGGATVTASSTNVPVSLTTPGLASSWPSASAPISAGAGSPPVARVSGADPRWYSANPILDEVLSSSSHVQTISASVRSGHSSPPTLFHSGDLPAFTASGIDPQVLRNVPWMTRHRIAATSDRAEALGLIEYVSGPEGLDVAGDFLSDVENRDYRRRVEQWSNDVIMAAEEKAQLAEHRRIAATSAVPTKATEDLTLEEGYDALFGDVERRIDARIIAEREAIAEGRSIGHGGYKGRKTIEERRQPW